MTVRTRSVVIPNAQGLHARPIALIAEAANKHAARLTVAVDGHAVDGRSILELMTLCAGKGDVLELTADGEDADQVISAVTALIENGFGEK